MQSNVLRSLSCKEFGARCKMQGCEDSRGDIFYTLNANECVCAVGRLGHISVACKRRFNFQCNVQGTAGLVLWDNTLTRVTLRHWLLYSAALFLSTVVPQPAQPLHPASLLSCRHNRELPSSVSHQEKVPRNKLWENYWLKVLNLELACLPN